MTLAPGTRLGPYDVVAAIGAGGMGEVWRAVDTRLGRTVAIKVLPASVASDRERVARFAREAKLLASLRHPGIATIHAFEELEGRQLLVMELAEGEGLEARIARGAVPLEDALPIARQIAEALEEAHEQGVVHRDLKPANVKVSADGRVKLLDFGLAKAMSGDAPAGTRPALSTSPTIEESPPTAAGVILGTTPYMAPEQARGRPVDRRADVWAFGVVLVEMLTGRPLFTGTSHSDVIANVLKQPIDLDALPRETPPAVRRLIARCLERDPRKRLRDVGEARVLLEDAEALAAPAETQRETPPSAAASPARGRGRVLAIAAAAAALGALGAWLLRPAPRPAAPRAISFPVERLTADGAMTPLLSNDGTRLLYGADNRVRVLSFTDPLAAPIDLTPPLSEPGPSEVAFWSHDGAHVAIALSRKLWRYPAGGGNPTLICDLPESGQILGGDWDARDEIVFAAWRGNLYRVPGRGGRPEVLLRRDPKTEVDFHYPRLLPEGRGLLFVTHRYDEETRRLDVLAEGGARKTVLLDGASIAHAVYSAGRILYDHANRDGIWEAPFSIGTLKAGVPRLAFADGTGPSLAADGTLAFVRGVAAPLAELVWVAPDGSVGSRVGPPMRGARFPALSPDEARVALSFRSDQHDDLSLVDTVRGTSTRLTATPDVDELVPAWSPSGKRIVFSQGLNFDIKLRSVDASGAAEPRDVGAPPLSALRAVVEPDGRHVVYMTDDLGKAVVSRVAVDADLSTRGEPATLSRTGIWWSALDVAPQGDLLAHAGLQSEHIEVFLARLEGDERWLVSNGSGQHPAWSGSGDRLFYVAGDDMMEVEVRRGEHLSLGAPRRLFSLAERRLGTGSFDVAKDGRFLMVRQAETPRVVVVVNGTSLLDGRVGERP